MTNLPAIWPGPNHSVEEATSNPVVNTGRDLLEEGDKGALSGVVAFSITTASLIAWLSLSGTSHGSAVPSGDPLVASPGDTTYLVDPGKGDDSNPVGKPWKTYGKLNSIKLAPGDKAVISPGQQEESLKPVGGGTAEKPVVFQFLPGIHTIGIRNVARIPMFVSNSMDSDEPKPVGILIDGCKHLRLQGGGVDGAGKTTILYDGKMVEIFNRPASGTCRFQVRSRSPRLLV